MKHSRYLILLLLTAFILSTRYNTNIAEWYAVSLYPTISAVLSFIVCWIPFSMEEIFVLGAILLSGIFLVRGIRKKERWYKVALYEIELVAWIVVWFYIGWGMNYFRQNIYERASVEKQKFNEEVFNHFFIQIQLRFCRLVNFQRS